MDVEDVGTLSSSVLPSTDSTVLEYASDEFQNSKLVIRNSAYKSTTTDEDGAESKAEEEAALSDEVIESDDKMADEHETPEQDPPPPPQQQQTTQMRSQSEKNLSEPIQSPDHSNYQLEKPAKLAFEVSGSYL